MFDWIDFILMQQLKRQEKHLVSRHPVCVFVALNLCAPPGQNILALLPGTCIVLPLLSVLEHGYLKEALEAIYTCIGAYLQCVYGVCLAYLDTYIVRVCMCIPTTATRCISMMHMSTCGQASYLHAL